MNQFCCNNFMVEEKQNTITKGEPGEDTHAFLLRRVESTNSSFVQVDFSPLPAATSSSSEHNRPPSLPSSIQPAFNHDGLHFTPSFVLPLEKTKTVKHQDTYLKLHEERVLQMSIQREELFVPRPSRSNSFCCICRSHFDDYLTHVNIPTHQKLLRSSSFCEDIASLTQLFNKTVERPVQPKKPGKTQAIKKRSKKQKMSVKLTSGHSSTAIYIEQQV